ncbi:MAG: hypothetical protein OJF58_005390 [Enhydrobacter sp.]|nr:MAG: hypothetical protein OJF58_005390 [Enhydrobacter sp.]
MSRCNEGAVALNGRSCRRWRAGAVLNYESRSEMNNVCPMKKTGDGKFIENNS